MDGFDEYRRAGLNESYNSDDVDFMMNVSNEEDNKEIEDLINDNTKDLQNETKENVDINNNSLKLDNVVEYKNFDEDEDEDKEQRCSYCGITNSNNLIKCNDISCQRWFCNGNTDDFSASHIIFHLTKSKHKEVATNAESIIPETELKCYHCDSKNIFLLGFLQSKDGNSGFILCRDPCLTNCKIEDDNFDKSNWISLIAGKKILESILPPPENRDLKICQGVTIRYMSKIEEKWLKEQQNKLNNNKDNNDFDSKKYVFLKSIKLTYEDGNDYLDIFEPIIQEEEKYDRKVKENQKKQPINATFNRRGKKIVARFIFPKEDNEIKLVPGDELKILNLKGTQEYKGYIIKMEIDDEVHLELEKIFNIPPDGQYLAEIVWKGTSFKRMLDGLYKFANDEESISSYLYRKILGHQVDDKKAHVPIPKDLTIKGLPELNYSQNQAIKKALQSPLFLIQGPPGTGKTVTSAAIVYHLAKSNLGKVLVCAPSNIAADQLSEKISKTGIKVVRVCAKSREAISTNIEYLSMHNLIRQLNNRDSRKLNDLMKQREEHGELSIDNYELYKKLKIKAETEVVSGAEVIVTTCVTALDKRLKDYKFPFVLVDEATQACESECLLPLLKGSKHVILVGDHCQLGPVILCKQAAKAGMKMSLFERLVKLKVKPHMLQVQYRMHPKLSEFPSNTFYSGNLQNGVNSEERIHHSVSFKWPDPSKPMFFYHTLGVEQFSSTGTSYLNQKEAEFVEKVVTSLLKSSVKPDQIGIITPYEGQRSYIVTYMLKNGSVTSNLYKEIEVASVDSFQGREKDYILLSCVRSNDHHGIGFLNDPRRLNVALTRAKYGLIIVGNAQALSKHQLWNNLLFHYKSNNLLVEGNLQGFRELIISLKPPDRYIPEKQCFESELKSKVDNGLSILENKNLDFDEDLLNDATFSRFSDFGYINDKESLDHHYKVKEILRNNIIKAPVFESLRNKFDTSYYTKNASKQIINNIGQQVFTNNICDINKMNKFANSVKSNKFSQVKNNDINSNIYHMFSTEKQFVLKTEF